MKESDTMIKSMGKGASCSPTETDTKETSSMNRFKVMASTRGLTGWSMKGNGCRGRRMALALRLGRTGLCTKGVLWMERSKDKGNINGRVVPCMKGISQKTRWKVKEFTSELMVSSIAGSGKTVRCMAKDSLYGQTGRPMKESS